MAGAAPGWPSPVTAPTTATGPITATGPVSTTSSAAQIGAAATRSATQPPGLVTLASGGKANFVLGVADAGNYPSGTCQPESSAYLKIYPPNQPQAVEVPFRTTGCASSSVRLLSVTVVSAGAANPAG